MSGRVLAASPDVLAAELGSEVALLAVRSGLYYSLAEVGVRVWQLIRDRISREDLLSVLLTEYDVEVTGLRRDLDSLLDSLIREGLVVERPAAE
jgi:hypothetical protein